MPRVERPHRATTPPRSPPAKRARSASTGPPGRVRLILFLAGLYAVWRLYGHGPGCSQAFDAALRRALTLEDAEELGDVSLSAPRERIVGGNPWAGSSCRQRADLVVAVLGCGGTFRRAAAVGDSVRLRYARRMGAFVLDSTRGRSAVDVAVGAGQAPISLEQALVGVCAGEVIRVKDGDRGTYLIAVTAIASGNLKHSATFRWASESMSSDEESDRLARAVVPVAARRRSTCSAACADRGLVCNSKAFAFVNNCPKLRMVFECTECEIAAAGTAGPDMPCHVSLRAPAGHPRGFCMVHPSPGKATCNAFHRHTSRLCPCLPPET